MVNPSLRAYLDAHHVAYRVLPHEPSFTAQETAHAAHVSGKRFAKVVLLEGHNGGAPEYLLAVLPAREQVDLERLGEAIHRHVTLAPESEFERLFPEFEAGAAPPFGDLTHVPVFADRCLGREGAIAFNAGTHADVVEMRWNDFERVAKPQVVDYGRLPFEQETTAHV
jgi:Ala-tRNA(Pro) deacylase